MSDRQDADVPAARDRRAPSRQRHRDRVGFLATAARRAPDPDARGRRLGRRGGAGGATRRRGTRSASRSRKKRGLVRRDRVHEPRRAPRRGSSVVLRDRSWYALKLVRPSARSRFVRRASRSVRLCGPSAMPVSVDARAPGRPGTPGRHAPVGIGRELGRRAPGRIEGLVTGRGSSWSRSTASTSSRTTSFSPACAMPPMKRTSTPLPKFGRRLHVAARDAEARPTRASTIAPTIFGPTRHHDDDGELVCSRSPACRERSRRSITGTIVPRRFITPFT